MRVPKSPGGAGAEAAPPKGELSLTYTVYWTYPAEHTTLFSLRSEGHEWKQALSAPAEFCLHLFESADLKIDLG